MVEEAYCTFEVAKLLKEKGFNCDVRQYYVFDHEFNIPEFVIDDREDNPHNWGTDYYSAPTQQMAMRWLREVHSIFIELHHYNYPGAQFVWYIWGKNDYEPQRANTYEEACEAAIKYCLGNLI